MTEAFIFDAVRTPRGKGDSSGALYSVKPVNLLAGLMREIQSRNGLDTRHVDDIVLGCVTPVGDQGGDIARTAALVADWGSGAAGMQVNRLCASGLEAVNLGTIKIRSGFEELVVVGGVESMSRLPAGSDGGAWMLDPQTHLHSHFTPAGIAADLIATIEGFTREQLDAYAVNSWQKAIRAHQRGAFTRSLMPVKDQNGTLLLAHDELIVSDAPTADAALAMLGALSPGFETPGRLGYDATALRVYSHVERIEHVHTRGNSCASADGAALMLLGSAQMGQALGLRARARIVATAVAGVDPTIMLTATLGAAHKALSHAGLSVADIDLFEVNEVFASVALKFIKDLQLDPETVNVNGGSIALGHPLGATGCIMLNTLLDELEARQLRYGLATLSAGAGMGIATIIERL